ncbi:MAG: type II secretion system F family protein [Burkholderiales bacterium]
MIDIKYLYKAANKAGQTLEGIIEANDKKAVISALRAKSLYLIELTEANPNASIDITLGSAKIPKKVLAVFCTQFASILKAGVPLIQALSILGEQIENKMLKKIVLSVEEDLQRGRSLSDAFSSHERALPTMMIKMIEAGEVSGTLDLSLKRLATQFEKENQISKKIKSAMMYPVIVCCVALLVVVFLLLFVVPKFTAIFESTGKELPGITKFVLSLSKGISEGWMFILIGLAVIYALFRLLKSSKAGRLQLDTIKLKAPVIGKASLRILTARLARALATLTSSGITLTQSIKIASRVVANKLAEDKLLDVEDSIKQGHTLHQSIKAAGLFPSMLMHMTKIGEESGTLDDMLEKAASYFEEEADSAISKVTALIQPILLVIVAVMVLFIILSVILPMFELYQSVA